MAPSSAFINSRNKNDSTPLHLACEWSTKSQGETLEITRILLDNGADFNAKDHNQMTPLHIASRDNSSEVIYYILRDKGHRLIKDTLLNLSIHYAVLIGDKDVILNNEIPLFLASREGHSNIGALPLHVGVEDIQPDINRRTALHRNVARGHSEIVILLHQAILNKEKEDKWGFIALNYAASWKGYQEVI
ncbi:unnamed protein product [Nezara viridula]|uniref:Ankyrin repeat protein n=1 Tax=Nezara viridula TaxID=85310 RepID=A0A9P0MLC6_NEZVI|nr:unnamed protein product [Nezara viridula]